MASRFQRTILKRYRIKKSTQSLGHLWFQYHRKMFGMLIIRGLKLRAYKMFSHLLGSWKKKERVEPRHLFLITCLRNTPSIIIKKTYVGSRLVNKPVALSRSKQPALLIRWLVKPLRDNQVRRNLNLTKLLDLLSQSLRRKGDLFRHKMSIYKIAKANRNPRTAFVKARRARVSPKVRHYFR